MVFLLVILSLVVFILVDFSLRLLLKRMDLAKIKKEREAALEQGLKLEFATEAKSLKRVVVEKPKARILAVDDENVILDSFRKILVLSGYSVDTVNSGPEVLNLIKYNDYDFVFTDLKMPGMDGIEVTKAVKHLRPDIDVIMITGYATIESAVETMKYGAMDYVQKPFTEEELNSFVNKCYIRREDRVEKQLKPKVHFITPSADESTSKGSYNIPSGVFMSSVHIWMTIEANGMLRLGMDDFLQKSLGDIEEIDFPKAGTSVKKGDLLFSIRQGNKKIAIPSPVSGKILRINNELIDRISLVKNKPYSTGWIVCVEPENLTEEITSLKIGVAALKWYQKEVDHYFEMVKKFEENHKSHDKTPVNADASKKDYRDEALWNEFSANFLKL